MATYILTLDGFRPTLLNEVIGRNWFRLHRRKKAEALIYSLEAAKQGIPLATGKRKATFQLWGWKTGRFPDWDAPLKIGLDSLVLAKLLLDDGQKGLASMPVVEYGRGEKRTVIILEDV